MPASSAGARNLEHESLGCAAAREVSRAVQGYYEGPIRAKQN